MLKKSPSLIYLLTLIIALCSMVVISACSRSPRQACFGSNCFSLEVARTQQQLAQGLMFREELGPDKGMLFIFEEEGSHCFWMKNTLIPLDIVWLSRDNEVVHIAKNVPPCRTESCPSICSNSNAPHVLELNAGTCDKIGLRRGDYAIIE